MTAPGIPVQTWQPWDDARSDGIQVDVSYQREEIGFFVANDGVVPILKQVARAAVLAIEDHGIAREHPPHDMRQPLRARAKHQMDMVGKQTPGETRRPSRRDQTRQAPNEVGSIVVAPKNLSLFDASHHDVVQHSWGVETRAARHGKPIA